MELVVFLPKELRGYRKALKLWGVLVNPARKVDQQVYALAYQAKLEMMTDREKYAEDLLEDHLGALEVAEGSPAEKMLESPEVLKASWAMTSYLLKEVSLGDLKKAWGLDLEKEEALSEAEQYELVDKLTLREYLDLVP